MFIRALLDWKATLFSVRVVSAGVSRLTGLYCLIIRFCLTHCNGVDAEDHSRRLLIRSGYRCHIWKCRTHLSVRNVWMRTLMCESHPWEIGQSSGDEETSAVKDYWLSSSFWLVDRHQVLINEVQVYWLGMWIFSQLYFSTVQIVLKQIHSDNRRITESLQL